MSFYFFILFKVFVYYLLGLLAAAYADSKIFAARLDDGALELGYLSGGIVLKGLFLVIYAFFGVFDGFACLVFAFKLKDGYLFGSGAAAHVDYLIYSSFNTVEGGGSLGVDRGEIVGKLGVFENILGQFIYI